jgi:drug/metabolite transporter (DMT)-like permease
MVRDIYVAPRSTIWFVVKMGFMKSTRLSKASSRSIWLAMLSIYFLWGSTYLAIRIAVETIPPFLMAGTRFLIAGSILYTFRRLAGDPAPTRHQWRSAAIIGLFLLIGGNGGISWAETRVASGIAALLVGTVPLWMVLIDAVRPQQRQTHNRLHWTTVLGVAIGFAGIAVLVSPSGLTGLGGEIDLVGALGVGLGALLWAVGSLYSRSADLPASPLLGSSMEMLCGGVGLIAAGTLTGEWGRLNLPGITWQSLAGIGYLVVFGSLIGFASYTWLLRNAPTTLVSTYAYVNPMVAIILGNLLAQEPFTGRILIAAAVIIGAVVIITLTQPAKEKQLPAPALE